MLFDSIFFFCLTKSKTYCVIQFLEISECQFPSKDNTNTITINIYKHTHTHKIEIINFLLYLKIFTYLLFTIKYIEKCV